MLRKLWNKITDLFLVKRVVSQKGILHFRRWCLFWTPWFAIYLHSITHSDEDIDEHEHPWDFASLILAGSYEESATAYTDKGPVKSIRVFRPGEINYHIATDTHKITILASVWSLVFVGRRKHDWGYQTKNGWVHHKEYNRLRRERKAYEIIR